MTLKLFDLDRRMKTRIAVAIITVVSIGCLGCGQESGPRLADVTGAVTLDGQPVEGAGLTFIVEGPGGAVAYGRTDEDGHYEMHFGKDRTGAVIGKNRVRITSDDRVTVGGKKFQGAEVFPPKYNTNSEQFVDVVEGSNEFNFACESGNFKARQVISTGGT
ncbi:MAG: hypothetical protein HY000_11005 [Planctomycetes bacterium]|nr:hypothetical protein [Planctomycetota bacterium]